MRSKYDGVCFLNNIRRVGAYVSESDLTRLRQWQISNCMEMDIYLVLVQNISFSLDISLSRFGKESFSSSSLYKAALILPSLRHQSFTKHEIGD
jgi:hypothetical protein